MKQYLYLGLLFVCFAVPSTMSAEMAYPEGMFMSPDQQELTAATTEDAARAALRQQLMVIVQLLQQQLAALLEEKAVVAPGAGQSRSFNTGVTVAENDDLKIEVEKTETGLYSYDGTDEDDDSIWFRMTLAVSNKNQKQSLVLDRTSLIVQPVGPARESVTPLRTFNIKTAHSINTSEYGYDYSERKLLVVKPGQTATVIVQHPYQFSEPGQYRGLLDTVRYTLESLEYDEATDQFTRRGRRYTLAEDDLQSLPVGKVGVMVESQFVDTEFSDDKYDVALFTEPEFPFTFSYPDAFSLTEDDDVWTLAYQDLPYIVVATEDALVLPEVTEEVNDEVGAVSAVRMQETTWTFSENEVSGTVTRLQPLSSGDYTILLYNYANTSGTFTAYDPVDILYETFVAN